MPARPVSRRRARAGLLAAALTTVAALAGAGTAVATSGPTAEVTGGQLFLGTTKVEVGARANGSFGSTSAAPAGYHPRTNSGTILGFRVNPDECDWADAGCTTRGDYFTPGTPYEVWGVQIGAGTPVYNDNSTNGIAGAFASADPTGVAGVWRSSADVSGALAVKLTYSIPPYGWLIDTTAELTNTSGSTLTDVYFLRGLDPDNCRMEATPVCDTDGNGTADGAGVYNTHNTVASQGSATTSAAVTATQTNDTFLALRPAGSEARVARQNSGFSNPASIAALWNGTNGSYSYAPGGTAFGDAGIYGVARIPSIAPGATARVDVQYVVKQIPAAADLTSTSPQAGVLVDVPGGNATGICSAPAHGTAVVEGGKVRYTPTPGYAGADSFTYSTGGPCGTVSVAVQPASPPAGPAPRDERVAVPLAPFSAKPAKGGAVAAGTTVTLPLPGRYTFIYVDASGRRVGQAKGSKVGSRTLRSRHSAPVLVTTTEGARVKLAAILVRKSPKGLGLRVVRRLADGTLTEIVLRP